ncbi:ankyrin repeat-containing protein At5g02620-like [Prosopis cineraria]|uniref:ankyrin repeat-containing protein At5g02620-like n=1 Tax=Prosopis cineraria TaxID=364024 RepID=UPI0024102641|nr:ankyrin repeat-containing protein At5g02620-like [Prosopis cineraria]
MEPKFYKAAVAGGIDVFKGKSSDQIESMLTPNKNTILHIHLTCYKANLKDETILHIAARYGHIEIVKIIVKRAKIAHIGDGIEETLIRATNYKKDTALHEAIRYNHKEIVDFLIKEDPHLPYFANSNGETPLYIATERVYEKIIDTLLENNNSPNHSGPNGRTALHAAIIHHEKITKGTLEKLILKIPSMVNEADDDGWSPLHLAVIFESPELIEMLLKHGGTAYMRDKKGRTALHLAAYYGNGSLVRKIIESCPDCSELVDHKGCNALHYTIAGLKKYTTNEQGLCEEASRVILKEEHLSNMYNEKDEEGNTPLHHLALYAPKWQEDHSHPLLEPNPRVDTMAFNKNNQTALDLACDIVPSTLQRENFFLRKLQHKIRASYGRRVINEEVKVRKQQKRRDLEVLKNKELVEVKTGNKEREKYDDEKKEIKDKMRETLLIVATLIATVTFAVGFTLPGGTIEDGENNKSSPILIHSDAFQTFVIANSLSFVLSAFAVFLQIFLPVMVTRKNINPDIQYAFFSAALMLTLLGMGFMIIAFGTGTYAILGPSTVLAVVTLVIAFSFFMTFPFVFYLLLKDVMTRRRQQGDEEKLKVESLQEFDPGFVDHKLEDMQLLDSI